LYCGGVLATLTNAVREVFSMPTQQEIDSFVAATRAYVVLEEMNAGSAATLSNKVQDVATAEGVTLPGEVRVARPLSEWREIFEKNEAYAPDGMIHVIEPLGKAKLEFNLDAFADADAETLVKIGFTRSRSQPTRGSVSDDVVVIRL
jgi:hypothetical protein